MEIQRPNNIAHPDIWEEAKRKVLQSSRDRRNSADDLQSSIVWGYAFLCGCRGLKPYKESRNGKQ